MSDAPGLETPDREDEAEEHPLTPRLFAAVDEAIEAEEGERLRTLLDDLHAADIADVLEQVDARDRREILRLFPGLVNGDVLSELDEGLREEVIAALTPEALAVAVRELDSDDVVDLIEDFEAVDQEAVLAALDVSDRVAVEQALAYPEYSAGRMMQRETVVAPEHWNVGQAIDHMRAHDDLPDEFYHVILVDPRHRPTGYVSLGKIMSQPRRTRLADITEDSFRTIDVLAEEGDVAYAFNQYHLISAPVTDAEGRLVGVITIDDAMIVLDDELEEDILRLAGVGEEGSSLSSSVREILRGRFPWLAVNLVTAILASMVISLFEGQIAQVVALAVLMPIVASMGGNAGTQSLTVAVRAIATRDLTGSNVVRVIRREMMVGLLNGLAFAAIMGLVGVLWFGMPLLGLVIAAAMVINLVVAALAGIGIPVLLERAGIDPALASGAFVTTVTDVVGFFAFLGLAALVLL